jgi:hypothetical protein
VGEDDGCFCVPAKIVPAKSKERGPSNTSKGKRRKGRGKEKREINK